MLTSQFLDTIGVNTHLGYTDSSYARGAQVLDALRYLGLDLVRDSAAKPGQRAQGSYDLLANAGIRFDMLVQPKRDPGEAVDAVAQFAHRHPGAVLAIEGPNEIDNWPVSYAGLTGVAAGIAFDAALAAAVAASDMLSGVETYSLTGAKVDTAMAFANYHSYAKGGNQPFSVLARNPVSTGVVAADTPLVLTEVGYHTAVGTTSGWEGVDQLTQAKLTLNLLFDAHRLGIERVYLYQLLDGYADPTGTSVDRNLGLFDVRYQPKLAATAIHNLTGILNAGSGAFTAPTLNLTVGNLPEDGAYTILEKAGGARDIVLWAEPDIWDQANDKPILVAGTTVDLDFGGLSVDVRLYDPLQSDQPIATYDDVTELSVLVTDHPVIVELLDNDSWDGGDTLPIPASVTGRVLTGTSKADTLTGTAGNDYLRGQGGTDSLNGGKGNDILQAGRGADRMTGGEGADMFLWTKPTEAPVKGRAFDTITDFSAVQGDRIALSSIDADPLKAGDQAFILGGSTFSGRAGEIIQYDGSGGWWIEADRNGDAVADMLLILTGVKAQLSVDSFIL